MSMNFPWYRACGRKTHQRGLVFPEAGSRMLCVKAWLLLPAALCPGEHLGIQLPQGPKGRVLEISNTLCPDWDLEDRLFSHLQTTGMEQSWPA